MLSIAYYIYTGVFEHHPNAIFASWARFAKRFFLFRVAPPQAAKKKMPGQFPNFGNWLAGGAVSEPMLETGWLAPDPRFPTLILLLYFVHVLERNMAKAMTDFQSACGTMWHS